MAELKFPSPHEAERIPGTEGWERMYPYHYQYSTADPERKKYEEGMFWFYDGLHYPEPMYPFDIIWDEAWFLALSQFNTRIFIVPPAMGIDHRIHNGYIYITPLPVENPEDIPQRVELFMKRAGYYYQNWDKLHDQWEEKMRGIIKQLADLEIPILPEMEDESVVTEGLGVSTGYKLLKAYDNLIDLGILAWQYHFEFLNLGYAAYVVFVDFCTKAFPDIPLQKITQMVGGIDVIIYQPDEELKKLARLAIELGVDEIVMKGDPSDLLLKSMEGSEGGKKWAEAFQAARDPWFYVSTGTGWYHHDSSWNDDLEIPLSAMRIYIEKLRAGQNIARPTKDVRAASELLTNEYRALLATDEDRQTYDQLLGTAKTVFPYVENHLFYVEHWFHSLFWNKMREVAAILKEFKFIEDVEDVWYMKRAEIKDALWDVVTAWATGSKPRGPLVWPNEIAWRKSVMEKFRQWTPPDAMGTVPDNITEPFTIVLWGITSQSMANWAKLKSIAAGDVNKIVGFPGSPGIVEGIVRVCRTVKEIGELKDGEILVAPTTSPSWAPAFQKIKAAVTDVGGVMCHAAIVCREYGLPAVVGTGSATSILKSGQRIRIDGSTGEVDIL
ncbi:MAG: PEP-utilizing enzyme, mobile region [Desulfomonile tiedjei]|uniref:PEP-utilizing enzyme, mobile region n=1 Tax=Desulfomonile tiedjei TaxID=2358 RepID=A0A9D6VA36_9BACT|nr:PEP-utilizing enzyme, mobile region [Desulfomonile tiedjei]